MGTGKTRVLAENGSTDWKIITGYPAAPAEEHAAQELRYFLQECSGAYFPVLDDRTSASPFEIIVGNNSRLPELGVRLDRERLGNDGFVIRTENNSLVIAGGSPRGTLYGVYTFLEEYLLCRWFTPSASRIPVHGRLVIGDIQDEQIPAFEYREPFIHDVFDPVWASRNKVNGNTRDLQEKHGGKIKYARFVHTFNELIPPEEYFDTHPEYFSERDGKRMRCNAQLCLTNPEVLLLATQKVRLWLRQDPEANIVSVSQNDCYNPCECGKCKRIDEYEGSPSGTLLRFVNEVARAIGEEFPHVAIDTLAYQYTRKAPTHTKPEKNVIIRLCTIECCFSHPLESCREISWPFQQAAAPDATFAEDLLAWSQICERVYIWDYVTNFAHYLMPFPNLNVLAPNIRFFADHHVKGVFEQGNYHCPGGDFPELKAYVLAKLLWNPRCDARALTDEFLEGYYGGAAAPIREYIDFMHDRVQDENIHLGIYDPPSKLRLTAEALDWAGMLFDSAERLADNGQILHRVKTARIPLEYVRLYAMEKDCPDRGPRLAAFYGALQASGITAVSEYLSAEECRRLTDQGMSPKEIEAQRIALYENGGEARNTSPEIDNEMRIC